MNVVLTLLVRDEEDILAANLAYHLSRGVDDIVVTDNASVDGTPDILAEYNMTGRVHVINEPEDTYAQAVWVTRMADIATSELGADWIIHCDADEFWWPTAGDLASTLAAVPPEVGVLECFPANFIPFADDRGFEGMTVREIASFAPDGSPLPPKVIHRAVPGAAVGQGNHEVVGVPGRVEKGEATILHYPMRSLAQFVNKISKGGAAYERNTELSPQVGGLWRELYALHEAGELDGWFRGQALDPLEVARLVASGDLVEDRRLVDYMAEYRRTQVAELRSKIASLVAAVTEVTAEAQHRQGVLDELAAEAEHRQGVIDDLAAEAQLRLELLEEASADRDRLARELEDLRSRVDASRLARRAIRRGG